MNNLSRSRFHQQAERFAEHLPEDLEIRQSESRDLVLSSSIL